jgi:hypothetical protein
MVPYKLIENKFTVNALMVVGSFSSRCLMRTVLCCFNRYVKRNSRLSIFSFILRFFGIINIDNRYGDRVSQGTGTV